MKLYNALKINEGHMTVADNLYTRYLNKLGSNSKPLFGPEDASFLYSINVRNTKFSPEYIAKKEIDYKKRMKKSAEEIKRQFMKDLYSGKLK